jgi:hypothetical protein
MRHAPSWADELKDMASAMQDVTVFGDEMVIEAQNILLTFTRIGKEVFPEVLERSADLATLMAQGSGGQISIKEAGIQLGKALNDPVKNLSALSRAGIQFTKEQTEQIKVLVESGKQLEAQKLILGELANQFGGTAKAARERLGGAFTARKNRAGDVLEEIGEGGLLKALDELSEKLLDTSNKAGSATGFQTDAVVGIILMDVDCSKMREELYSSILPDKPPKLRCGSCDEDDNDD